MLEKQFNKFLYSFLRIDKLLEIRAEFFEFYKHVANHPKFFEKIKTESKEKLFRNAIEHGVKSELYDTLSGFKKFAIFLQIVFRVIYWAIGYSLISISNGFSLIIPIFLEIIIDLYIILFRFANRHLRYSPTELSKFKRKNISDIYSANVWNRSLMSINTIPIVQFLLFIKISSESLHMTIHNLVKIYTRVYLDFGGSHWKAFAFTMSVYKKSKENSEI